MLGGSGGGYPDEAAARDLARAGYPVFALAYFRDYGGDPAELEQRHLRNVPLEYIFEALDWLQARPEVRADRIVLMGESRGAELALMIGSLKPDVAGEPIISANSAHDRKSTRLNSRHSQISYAVFCLKNKKTRD